jgi:type IV pilus assembly protein PilB
MRKPLYRTSSQLVEAIVMFDDFDEWGRMDYVHPRLIVIRPELADLVPEAVARENNVLPQMTEGRVVTILISDPLDFELMDRLRFILGSCSVIRFAVSSREAIREAIERVYGNAGT